MYIMSVVSVVCCWIFSHILLIHLKYMYFVESSFFLKMIFYYFNKEKNIKNILDISEFNQFEKWKIKFKVKSPSKKIMYSHTISDIPSHKFTTHLTPQYTTQSIPKKILSSTLYSTHSIYHHTPIPYHTTLHHTTPHHITPYYITLHHTTPHTTHATPLIWIYHLFDI